MTDRLRLALVLSAPSLLAASIVVTTFADSALVLDGVVRPLIVAVGGALIVQAVASVMVRSWNTGSALAIGVVAGLIDSGFLVLTIVVSVLWFATQGRARRVPTESPAIVTLILFVIAVTRAAGSPALDLDDLVSGPRTPRGESDGTDPDIYLILLDGYARSDTLAEFGHDNGWFEDELGARGFRVSRGAHSNYSYTAQVLSTMLHMRHLHQIDALNPPPRSNLRQNRSIVEAVKHNPVTRRLHERGYWIVSAGVPNTVIELRDSDEYREDGRLTNFEHQVLSRTSLWGLLRNSFVLEQHREQILATFDEVERVARQPRDPPTFMLAHVLSPHTPLVFEGEGGMPQLSCGAQCQPFEVHDAVVGVDPIEFGRAYGDQTAYINRLTLEAVDAILAASPEAIVIVFSDHGSRHNQDVNAEWFKTLFAARTPGHPALFGQKARPIEIFPLIFNDYFGDRVAVPRDVTYQAVSGLRNPLDVVRWPPSTPD